VVVLRLRSPLAVTALGLVALGVLGLALLRVDTVWVAHSEVVVSGHWGAADGEFGRGAGADGRPRGPQAIAADDRGALVVADSLNFRLQIFDRTGRLLAILPVTAGAAPARSDTDRAALYGRLGPCLGWGSGFRPRPDIAAPARSSSSTTPAAGGPEAPAATGTTSPLGPVAAPGIRNSPDTLTAPYITDLALSGGAWRLEATSGRIDPASGPDIYLLAGWEGVVLTTDAAGSLKWTRDLSTPTRFAELGDPYNPEAGVTPESWAGYMLDLDTLRGGGVVVAGYELLPDKLLYFLRALPEVQGDPKDLCAYELVRDGSVKVDDSLPIALEVESMAVGGDGLLYIVAGGDAATSGPSPFAREIWVFTTAGRGKGRIALDCRTYTRHLRMIGVDGQGLLYTRQSVAGSPGCLAVFDGAGRAVLAIPLSADAAGETEVAEVADVCLGGDGALYASLATDEGYQVIRYRLGGQKRLAWRWTKGG
jgi:hypothetical protein